MTSLHLNWFHSFASNHLILQVNKKLPVGFQGRAGVACRPSHSPSAPLPSPLAGYSDPASAGCKQFTVGFAALEDSSSTATAEIAVNGMDPPELGFPPAEPTKGTSGQWRRSQADKIEARVVKKKKESSAQPSGSPCSFASAPLRLSL